MREAVICSPLRTATGGLGGSLRGVRAQELAAIVLRDIIARTGLSPELVDEVVLGHSYPTMDAPSIGRVAALDAGLPVSVAGLQLDRRCGSGLQAVLDAAMRVQTGVHEVVIAGGAESMSNAPFYSLEMRNGGKGKAGFMLHDALIRGRVTAAGRNFPTPGGMLEMAENLRRVYGITRREQDEYALKSHQSASQAASSGKFEDEIVAVNVTRKGVNTPFVADEHIRHDANLEALGKLRPVRLGLDAEATVTAGNASGQNDGAAACIVTHPDKARELGLEPLLKLRSWAAVGLEPDIHGIGPVPASAKALAATGLELDDMGLIELNEAFASQVLACCREWELDPTDTERLNVNGSGISLGHPIGATGARILTSMAYEMRRRGTQFALETMCVGGGMGLAAVFEQVVP